MILSFDEYIGLVNNESDFVPHRIIREPILDSVLSQVIKERPDLKKCVILNKFVPENILVSLADDEDQEIRCLVATKRKTPPIVLEKLAHDPVDYVRGAVVHNAKASKQILDYLSHDDAPEVAEKAMRRLREHDFKG